MEADSGRTIKSQEDEQRYASHSLEAMYGRGCGWDNEETKRDAQRPPKALLKRTMGGV